jgi:hypothetical protein
MELLFIINILNIKKKKSQKKSGQTARMCGLAWLYTYGKGEAILFPAG